MTKIDSHGLERRPKTDKGVPSGKLRKPSKKIREALRLIIEEGADKPEAAQRADVSLKHLERSLDHPHVRAWLNERVKEYRTLEAIRSLPRVRDLRDNSGSDNVKLESAKFLAGIEGIVPVKRTEIEVGGSVALGFLVETAEDDDSADVISDVPYTAEDT